MNDASPHHVPVVLVVEDEALIRMLVVDGLEDAGMEVLEARDAGHALNILHERSDVALVFTDYNMPGSMNGLDLVRVVHEQWPRIKLVVTSGRSLPLESLPDDGSFVQKPVTISAIVDLVQHKVAD